MTQATLSSQQQRRSSVRQRPKGDSRAKCLKGTLGLGPDLAVSIIDISQTGIGLVTKTAVQVGQKIEVTLSSMGLVRPIKQVATVARCEQLGEGKYCVGARFDRCLSYGEYQGLIKLH